AMSFNPDALVAEELSWRHDDLMKVYEEEGIPAVSVAGWSAADLLRGLLAQCCNVELAAVVAGYPECAYPQSVHACEADVFADVFAGWVSGLR
ncbi:hypothetical protein ACF057_29675, partial [Rhodococcus erythropolis]